MDLRKVNDLYLMLDLALEYTGHLFHHLNLVNCTKTEVNTPLDISACFWLYCHRVFACKMVKFLITGVQNACNWILNDVESVKCDNIEVNIC